MTNSPNNKLMGSFLLFIIFGSLFIGTEVVASHLREDNRIHQILTADDSIYSFDIAIGTGQELKITFESTYNTKIIITKLYSKGMTLNDTRVLVLQETTRSFQKNLFCKNFTIFQIEIENSYQLDTDESNGVFIVYKVEKVDLDVIVTSLGLMFMAILLQLLVAIFKKGMILKDDLLTFIYSNGFLSRNNTFQQFQDFHLVIQRENGRNSDLVSYIFLGFIVTINNPSQRFTMFFFESEEITMFYLLNLIESLQFIILFIMTICIYVYLGRWSNRFATTEVFIDYSLPIKRRNHHFAMLCILLQQFLIALIFTLLFGYIIYLLRYDIPFNILYMVNFTVQTIFIFCLFLLIVSCVHSRFSFLNFKSLFFLQLAFFGILDLFQTLGTNIYLLSLPSFLAKSLDNPSLLTAINTWNLIINLIVSFLLIFVNNYFITKIKIH